jgi:hypothetical protein
MTTPSPVVLITGALTGIGRATALAFAREGASLVVSGRRDEAGHALAAELRTFGVRAEYLRADVRNEAEVRSITTDDGVAGVAKAGRGCGTDSRCGSSDGDRAHGFSVLKVVVRGGTRIGFMRGVCDWSVDLSG